MVRYALATLALSMFLSTAMATDYEDGVDASDWSIFDATPAGAAVASVENAALGSDVIETRGSARSNGFMLGGTTAANGWNATDATALRWRMASDESYVVYVRVDTALGWRYLVYTASNRSALLSTNGRYVYHGLGSRSRDGRWYEWHRDLAADLAAGEPDNTIVAVQGFLVRGSVRLDDIALEAAAAGESTVLPRPDASLLANAEGDEAGAQGARFRLFDANPAGAEVGIVDDAARRSRVYAFQTDGRRNGFVIGGGDAIDGLRNRTDDHLSFAIATDESYEVLARVETSGGLRYLSYTSSNSDAGLSSSGEYLRFGLGSGTRDGTWHDISRDLSADLARFDPSVTLTAVHGIYVRGTVRLDDVRLTADAPPVISLARDVLMADIDVGATFDASASTDPEGEPLSYAWLDLAGEPLGSDPLQPLAAAAAGDLGATLVVSDAGGLESIAQVTLTTIDASVATVYEDGADDAADRWRVADASPAGASVTTIDGLDSGGADDRVVALQGDGRRNGYLIGNYDGRAPGWDNSLQFGFSMRFAADEFVSFYVRLETLDGPRYLEYQLVDRDYGPNGTGTTIRYGLGGGLRDGQWHAFARDLEADLVAVQPENRLLAVHGVYVRGSVRVDDIALDLPEPEVVIDPPEARFAAVALDDGSQSVQVDATGSTADGSRTLVGYTWNFGDGTEPLESADPIASHVYASPGAYDITLTVVDSADETASLSESVTVLAGDGGTVGGDDGATDGGIDGGADGATDGATDGGVDGGTDGSTGGVDGGTDGGSDGSTDGGSDGATDGGTPLASAEAAARLLAQASFGTTEASIADVRSLGLDGWIDAQLALPVNAQLPRVKALAGGNSSRRAPRHDVWWQDVVEADDQLRQRVAFALSEIFVVADTGYTLGNAQFGMTAFYDRLLAGAFGDYRTLLEEVTLSPVMGVWLSMLQNERGSETEAGITRADENFAREVLQLFSIGLHELGPDGTPQLVDGAPVPAFDTDVVAEYARVFTGWNFANADRWNKALIASNNDYEASMQPYDDGAFHDTGAKTLLGGVVSPENATAEADLATALDSIANHANVAPFISRQLIVKLVTSNPTAAYVGRAAEAFRQSGGNLGVTVKAILLDVEARDGPATVPGFGKLREPILRLSHLWRAFDIERGTLSTDERYNVGSPQKETLDAVLGQAPLKSPSVFNFFAPDHSPVGPLMDAGMSAPEAELYTDALVLSTTDRINRQIQLYHDAASDNERKQSHLVLEQERALANDVGALLDHLDLLLLAGSMSPELRGILTDHLEGIPAADERGRSTRVRDAITLIMASPAYLVQQ